MIEILNKSDINKVGDISLKEYLQYSFRRLPLDYIYPTFGYFVVIESLEELINRDIKLSVKTIPSLTNGLYDNINMVELHNDIMEVVVFIDNDMCVSFIVPINILDENNKLKLHEYIL